MFDLKDNLAQRPGSLIREASYVITPHLMGRRSARRLALADQALALLRDAGRCLSTSEIADRLDEYHADTYPVLQQLADAQRIDKVMHTGLRHALWGAVGAPTTVTHHLAVERRTRADLEARIDLAARALERGDAELALAILRDRRT